MSQQQKRVKLEENYDIISQLPMDLLSQLVSLLPLKEALKTSTLSKTWKTIWTTHTDIVCDISSVLGVLRDESGNISLNVREEHRNQFIERVCHLMQQRLMGPNMRSIVISFPLSRKDGPHVARWVGDAVMKGVQTIILNLNGGSGIVSFPFSILRAPGQASKVRQLGLNSCSLKSLSVRNRTLDSLVNIHLQSVNLTDKQMDVILSKCFFLESLILRKCDKLARFKLSRNPRLKLLDIRSCLRLKSIELYAESLQILEFDGLLDHFSFDHVPKLVQLFACVYGEKFVQFSTYALSRIAVDAPLLQTLTLQARRVLPLPKGVFTFTNIKYLVLKLNPCDGEDELDWIRYILKAFPSLNRLEIDFSLVVPRNAGSTNQSHRGLAEVSHENLRELEVTGYYGGPGQVEAVKHLVDRAFKLDLLVISSPAKLYVGLRESIRVDLRNDNKSSSEKIEELRSVLPNSLRVDYSNV
ncbi:hypothetical protein DCAR_0832643 [Daucus carota subsp. sativus]|uniref:F-box domain-containing protein n=2 Tax=Daucus carota subsp. sativus TaxID=79200 RepID=A0A175YQA8_DAUCS|nr:hypothetical protein DCAR_0832643 [Daucus carota subsp. sativus]